MKIAVVYNRESRNVINLFGAPNQEKIGLKTVRRVVDALKKGGHQVIAFEGDKDLVEKLENFMPRVVKGERPGMVFNISYGIQGQARYTHVPSILEMVGVPYVGSGPLAHSLSLDKVVTKMILRQHGLPTPDFAVLEDAEAPVPDDLRYPLIVKPKNEAVSFGLKVVHDEAELREAAQVIFDKYRQAVLVEQYIEGREVNVGLLGNSPPEALPPVELIFGEGGPAIYTYEDKTGRSGRSISHACPAPIGEALLEQAKELAVRAFSALGCADCARVDMRLDKQGRLYILEINSLPSLGEHGSYLVGAAHVGLDFAGVINRLVEVAAARYFGTPEPPAIDRGAMNPDERVTAFVTQRRDEIERHLQEWCELISHTIDPVGVREAVRRADQGFQKLGLKPAPEYTDERAAWTWQTARGFEGGILFVGHLDVPVDAEIAPQRFRREAEWLYGDGIGSSRAPLVMLNFALRALREQRLLRRLPLGVLCYTDEGRDARYSQELIHKAASRVKRMLVLRPGGLGDSVITQRRGRRLYRLRVVGEPARPGRVLKQPEPLRWLWLKLEKLCALSDRKKRLSISALDVHTERLPMLLPHRVTSRVLVTYPDAAIADEIDARMREILGQRGRRWELDLISDRPPMKERRGTLRLLRSVASVAEELELKLKKESSVWPSVAGLAPAKTACLCGIGPIARDLGTPQEAVQRISLIQRTLLLARYFLKEVEA
ncbi:MAG: ATP-grasp domain-containing protein [Planctomycetota bacterium]|nr:MAG: ATP-grasp domain-containing protein [Planctomycetota bacterium]